VKINPFNKVFSNTQNSYKYYWFLSIIEICNQKKEISFDEIVLKIISKLWFPVNYFKLSFGKIDQCSKHIRQIQKNYQLKDNINEKDLYEFLIESKDSEFLLKIINELTRYVPYRFIRPWFTEQTRGLKDGLVNSRILEVQNESAPYKININLKTIKINQEWIEWIKINYTLIKSYTLFELTKYLEKENPNITNLSKKLEKPDARKLTIPKKHWKQFIIENPHCIDVFQKKPLIEIENLNLDHFLPWSFLTHDLIWNLHPIDKSINSSKSNFIPKKSYFQQFFDLQYNFCNYLLKNNINKPLEDYYKLFNCSNEELNNLQIDQFKSKMDEFYLPQYEIAKNMGFKNNWSLNQL